MAAPAGRKRNVEFQIHLLAAQAGLDTKMRRCRGAKKGAASVEDVRKAVEEKRQRKLFHARKLVTKAVNAAKKNELRSTKSKVKQLQQAEGESRTTGSSGPSLEKLQGRLSKLQGLDLAAAVAHLLQETVEKEDTVAVAVYQRLGTSKAVKEALAHFAAIGALSVDEMMPLTTEAAAAAAAAGRTPRAKPKATTKDKAESGPPANQPQARGATPAVWKRKNRMSQRARQTLAEEKYGDSAKHLAAQEGSKGTGKGTKRGAPTRDSGRSQRQPQKRARHSEPSVGGRASRHPAAAKRPAAESKGDEGEKLHPSWEARKNQKTTAAFEGKRITFDDD